MNHYKNTKNSKFTNLEMAQDSKDSFFKEK
jgi:Na+-driven multidrug efflux pump